MLILALFIVSIASVSASDVSDINDNQNYLAESDGSVSEDLDNQEIVSSEMSDSTNDNSELIGNDNGASDDSSAESSDIIPNSDSVGDSSEETTKNSTTITSSSSKVVNGEDYSVTLKDKDGNPVSGKNLIFTFNGNNYTRTTDSNGVASLKISGKAGVYTIAVLFEGDELYENSSISTQVTVSKTPTSITNASSSAIKGKAYYVVLKDKNGKVLSSKKVTLSFNGKTYTKTTDSKGKVSLTITGTVAKTYKLTYKFAGDDYYAASSGSVSLKVKMPTKIVGSDARIVKGSKYTVTLKDSNNKALSKKTVKVLYNGKTYTKTTSSKGVVTLTLSPTPGKTYEITYKYAGSSYYGASSKKVNVFIKTPTKLSNSGSSVGKGKYYYITLKDYKGKVLTGKTVSITYRGKTYKKTTNSKGQVSLKINSPIGYTYKLSYKYGGSSYYGSSSGSLRLKTKMATSLSGPSATTIIKGSAYKVTLKDGNGKVLSGKTITFTLDGKTYTKTTSSKGVASLTISLAAGKTYKLSYKYAGTSYYNRSSSGTKNIAVKLSSNIKNSGSSIMNNSSYVVTLRDSNSKILANKLITFNFDSKTYTDTTDANGAASLFIVENSPKTAKLTYSFAGDSVYDASSGSVNLNVKSDKVFTFNQIVDASKSLRSFVESKGYLPSTVSVNGINVNITSFAYLMSKSVININNGKKLDVEVINISSNYTNNGSSSINADLNKTKYIDLANALINGAVSDEKLPSSIDTNIGEISPNLYIFGLSKALDFYSNNNRLPNYITFNAKDVDGTPGSDVNKRGNTAQYKKGLNEVQALTSAQLAQYLSSSGNDALNSAIRSLANDLTAGKSTVWAKAEAIFNWVRDKVKYEYYANTKYKATGTLSNKRGNCCDHANLIVALCRAADIPARYSHGKNCKFSSGLNTGHVWAQIYVDGVWYSADATSSRNKLGNIQNWNTNSFTLLGQYAHLSF